MATILLPISVASAGAAAILNTWISLRVSGTRRATGISVGDGGNPVLSARMRAHANFVENTPFVLILIALIEFNIGSAIWLSVASMAFMLGRVAHVIGMDGVSIARKIGASTTLVVMVGLGIYAAALPFIEPAATAPRLEAAPAKG